MARSFKQEDLASKYMELRTAGVPTWVTADEAYRMTDGVVGTQGDSSGENGFTLAALVTLSDGNVHLL